MIYEDRVTKEYLEDAIANAGVKIITGTYTGDGAETRLIDLGFTPRAVFVISSGSGTYLYSPSTGDMIYYGGIAIGTATSPGGVVPAVKIVDGGFQVAQSDADGVITGTTGRRKARSNNANAIYRYLAIA